MPTCCLTGTRRGTSTRYRAPRNGARQYGTERRRDARHRGQRIQPGGIGVRVCAGTVKAALVAACALLRACATLG
eukprot:7349866-Pyramimonas_sp.AAC.1